MFGSPPPPPAGAIVCDLSGAAGEEGDASLLRVLLQGGRGFPATAEPADAWARANFIALCQHMGQVSSRLIMSEEAGESGCRHL